MNTKQTAKMESCVETPAAPEWLSKLESRREKLTKSKKLGHESGAGAPCSVCGSACPGLDLHFWRKVCRNCKCRKDQHQCDDDDLSGWAQFEILGQIRSKPAFIKIKALADQPVKVEWIPPNVAPDIASEYMEKLDSNLIPIAGSDAASKRKQQLEFQVPPHDLDATLCDNLTEAEAAQLEQYVNKVRDHCVGQGNVVRVGVLSHGIVGNVGEEQQMSNDDLERIRFPPPEVFTKLQATPAQIMSDRVLMAVLSSQNLTHALLCDSPELLPDKLMAFERALSPDFNEAPLAPANKQKLRIMHLNTDMVKSLVENGPVYDNLVNELKRKQVNFAQDPILVPIDKFRTEYNDNEQFQNDMDKLVDDMKFACPPNPTPTKSKQLDTTDPFHSPIPLRNPIQTRVGSLVKQETPMRKIRFGGVSILHDLGFPADVAIERDQFLAKIVNSEVLQNAVRGTASPLGKRKIILSDEPLISDFGPGQNLNLPVRRKLETIGVNQQAVQSAVVNAPLYEKLFNTLKDRNVDYSECKLLDPIDQFRDEFTENLPFQKEITRFVETLPNNVNICCLESQPVPGQYYPGEMHGSKSTDSGFGTLPSTPNYAAAGQGVAAIEANNDDETHTYLGIDANMGKLNSIPGIEDMNMYPQIKPTKYAQAVETLPLPPPPPDLECLQLNDEPVIGSTSTIQSVAVLQCQECTRDIMSGEVAVKAERAGKDTAWHPQCFVCHTCRQLLADLVYFFHGGHVYCGRDLALILKIPRCNACDELIFTKEYTAAEGATFHIKHFCCYQCDEPLAGQHYVPDEKTNMPLCLNCYDIYYAERCQFCKHVIGPAEQGVAWGKFHWHGECFMCAGIGCGKSLLGGRFCVKDNKPFCSGPCMKSVIP